MLIKLPDLIGTVCENVISNGTNMYTQIFEAESFLLWTWFFSLQSSASYLVLSPADKHCYVLSKKNVRQNY